MAAARADTTPFATALAVGWLGRTRQLMADGLGICVTDYEFDEGAALLPLVEHVSGLVGPSLELFQEVASCLDGEAPASMADVDLFGEVERQLDQQDDLEVRISGIAFIARGVLQSRRRELAELTPPLRTWDVVTVCSRATREAHKSLSALEIALCELTGQSPSDTYSTEREIALKTRRAYTRFRADVLGLAKGKTLVARLRFAGTAIAKLVGRNVYTLARVHDRWMVRRLQSQIRAWLLGAASDGETLAEERTVAGERLLQEIANVSELMMQINQRAELRVHDLEQVGRLREALDADADFATLDALRAPLLGRSLSLDALDATSQRSAWSGAVLSIREELGVMATSAPPPRSTWTTPPTTVDVDWSEL
ncbi:MAG: hypothetical protein JNL79_38990 [Myxococcales bacterium]|nr:hypothetical protein [Myxococcales bacterium]